MAVEEGTIRNLSPTSLNKSQAEYIRYLDLYKAIDRGDLKATKEFLHKSPEALTAPLTASGDTALHIAVLAGNTKIVQELVKGMLDRRQSLEIKNSQGATPLIYAAGTGIVRNAECLVTNSHNLVSIPDDEGLIPVVVASLYGHRHMVEYLYSVTPGKYLDPAVSEKKNGATLLTTSIIDEFYDVALDLLRRYPQLAYTKDTDNDTALEVLAQTPSAFPSATRLRFWQWWIYSGIQIGRPRPSSETNRDIERPQESPAEHRNTISRGFRWLQDICWTGLKFLFPGIKHLYDLKLKHFQTEELLRRICQEILAFDESKFKEMGTTKALFLAVEHGAVEVVVEMINQYPDIIYISDEEKRNIFLYAARQRQGKVFSLIYKIGAKKSFLAAERDSFENNMLHQAAFLAPQSQLDRVPGAALQSQRELQWFKEVENLVQPRSKKIVNKERQTPETLFTQQHEKLLKEGEKWMKKTAESCTVVAALIATVVFSAAFTIPGDYNDMGLPNYLHVNSFLVFLISDALSLFTSTTSILLFLGILKSRYQEQDFLVSLPTKLIFGLSMLCISMATMMVAFATAVLILLREKIGWIAIPVILLSSLPVGIFAVTQFHLLTDIICSTYGPGFFDKPRKLKLF